MEKSNHLERLSTAMIDPSPLQKVFYKDCLQEIEQRLNLKRCEIEEFLYGAKENGQAQALYHRTLKKMVFERSAQHKEQQLGQFLDLMHRMNSAQRTKWLEPFLIFCGLQISKGKKVKLAEACRSVGIPRPTAYRMLKEMQSLVATAEWLYGDKGIPIIAEIIHKNKE